MILNAVNTGY